MSLPPINKVLIIRFKKIGDVIISSVICDSIRASFPNAQIDYLMHQPADELLIDHPSVDNTIGLSKQQRKNPLRYLLLVRKLAKQKYDVIIDANATTKSSLIAMASPKCHFRIGRFKRNGGYFYTHKIKSASDTKNKISERLSMLQPLAEAGYDIKLVRSMQLTISEKEKADMRSKMQAQGIDFARPIFAFSVAAQESAKMWNQHALIETITHCREQYGAQCVLFRGLPHESLMVDDLYQQLSDHQDIFVDVPISGLRSLPILFSQCDIFIGNEGGPRHMAECVGIPTVAVFSPKADIDEWLPNPSDRHRAIEWRDVVNKKTQETEFVVGDERYFALYNAITATDFIPLVDQVVSSQLTIPKQD